MTAREVTEVCANLRAMLGGEVGRHPRLPSLALLERALMKNGEHGIDDVPAAVLRHAAQALDAFDLDATAPASCCCAVAWSRCCAAATATATRTPATRSPTSTPNAWPPRWRPGALKDFSDSLTEFISIDRMFGDRKA